jgi:hypothetical protein
MSTLLSNTLSAKCIQHFKLYSFPLPLFDAHVILFLLHEQGKVRLSQENNKCPSFRINTYKEKILNIRVRACNEGG